MLSNLPPIHNANTNWKDYNAHWHGQTMTIRARTPFQAQLLAAAQFKVRDSWAVAISIPKRIAVTAVDTTSGNLL